MKTKLVYVLTCSPEKNYIEQAVMATFSCRYHNPDAHIVLFVDDETNYLIENGRGIILNYVNEKIVVSFSDNSTMMYRSRWIKTSIRSLIEGDFLYIDCDTIVCKPLDMVDSLACEVGAVYESHLLVEDFCDGLYEAASKANAQIGVDLSKEKEYFSSGVLYVKDSSNAHQLYSFWHQSWLESIQLGLPIDQPSLAKANRESGHLIKKISDTFNCILFTQNSFTRDAHILHISSYRNPSFLFTGMVLDYVKNSGLPGWVKDFILHPCDSFLPFDYMVRQSTFKDRWDWIKSIAATCKTLSEELPNLINEFPMHSILRKVVLFFFHHNCFYSGAFVWVVWKRLKVLRNDYIKDNVCRK